MNSLLKHSIISFILRLLFIAYGEFHDRYFRVSFTDIDYSVFTDAARYTVKNMSPYERHTYRYTPLLAFLLTPNIFLHPLFGKVLFSFFDIFIAILIKEILLLINSGISDSKAVIYSFFWLYNPISIIISTRGNSDSVIGFLSLMTLFCFLKRKYLLAGIFHGLSIHFRLFPVTYSLAYYLAIPVAHKIENVKLTEIPSLKSEYKLLSFFLLFKINFERLKLVFSCVITFAVLTFVFYALYGYIFLYESYIYHLVRKDIRHNFSVYFYFLYLMSNVESVSYLQKFLMFLPQLVLFLMFSLKLNHFKQLPFCLLCITFTIVAYNPVLTSQYFVWFLPFLPICLPDFSMNFRQITILSFLWVGSQLAWLLPAYWLEFRGHNTFFFIWLQGIAFFCSNIAILSKIVKSYQIQFFANQNKLKSS